jgi:formylglycine-generating enzyme required for sulfatase activity
MKGKIYNKIIFVTIFFFLWACLVSLHGTNKKQDGKETQYVTLKKGYIEKPGVKKKKKKSPLLFIACSVVAAGVVMALLLKKKRSPTVDEWQYTGPVNNNYDVNELGIQWVEIPAGEFLMGNNINDGPSHAHPVHPVYLDNYRISKFEVTFEQFEKFCLDKGCPIPDDEGWGRGNRPVIHVNWQGAKNFCDWLSKKTGKNIHLPTEAQWEKAARGTDQRPFPWGDANTTCDRLNFYQCHFKTMPVGSYPSGVSPYGIHDMAGNVAEWCQDYYSENFYSNTPYNNPQGPSIGTWRVLRGGSHGHHVYNLTSFSRTRNAFYRDFSDVGFRLVCE